MSMFTREPVLSLGFVQSALALALAFGANLSTEQVGAVLACTAALLSVLARTKVTPG